MKRFSRRSFLAQSVLGAALTYAPWSGARSVRSRDGDSSTFVVTLELKGGADVTQFCDPKINVEGHPKINHWADQSRPGRSGNLHYAPVADNEWLFTRFGADMLIINGVDVQTNSHDTGLLFNFTGSNSEGQPSLGALHAACFGPDLPLAYSVFGGTTRTSGLITYNRFRGIEQVSELARPNWDSVAQDALRPELELSAIANFQQNRMAHLANYDHITPRQRLSLQNLSNAIGNRARLLDLVDLIPDRNQLEQPSDIDVQGVDLSNDLRRQIQSALIIAQSGLGCAADLVLDGFDSHEANDSVQQTLFSILADGLGYFWDLAGELGVDDRILLVIGTDFGRTNHYNDADGKDHWNVGSYVLMEKNARWGNRVVGLTDPLHFARRVDRKTLKDSEQGVLITPAHIHKALRHYLGLDQFAMDQGLDLSNVELLPIFDSSVQTVAARRSRLT